MSAFTLCWFPFFVLALVRPFMSHQTASLVIPHWLSSLFLWLGYANSFLNPVIYATTNKDFRLPFREILCLRCKSLNSVMREDFYQSQYGNNQQLMGNNNKGGLMATGGHPSSSPSTHAKLQSGHHHKSRRRRRYSTDGLADDEQQNERIMSHQQDRQPNASAISKVDVSVSATGDEEEEDTVTDYGLLSSGHRISSSSATAFL
jgi:5-hydroxytryptamine receptor 7